MKSIFNLFLLTFSILFLLCACSPKKQPSSLLESWTEEFSVSVLPLIKTLKPNDYEKAVKLSIEIDQKYISQGLQSAKTSLALNYVRLALIKASNNDINSFNQNIKQALAINKQDLSAEAVSKLIEWVVKSNNNYNWPLDTYKKFWNPRLSEEENIKLIEKFLIFDEK